jgi:hypothetical protein
MDSEFREGIVTILYRLDRIEARLALMDPVALKQAWTEASAAVTQELLAALDRKESEDGVGEAA